MDLLQIAKGTTKYDDYYKLQLYSHRGPRACEFCSCFWRTIEVYKYLLGNKHDATIHLKLNWAVFSFVRHSPIFLVGGSSLAFH